MDKLPILHCRAYRGLRSHLEEIRDRNINLDEAIDPETLTAEWQNLQCYFQTEILTLTAEDLDAAQAHHWQSLQTEIYRTMRLLNTDLLFLRASRQAATTEQRLRLMGDRVTQLMGYCQLLTEDPSNSKFRM